MAHIQMLAPCGRYNAYCGKAQNVPSDQSLHYDMNSPLDPAAPLCRFTEPWRQPVATWKAGDTVDIKFKPGGAAHGGGHCQFSISYDNGKTFVVIHEVLKHCFKNGPSNNNNMEVTSYSFQLPKNLPKSDKALFAWTWVNAIGNREFYMNCADVTINSQSTQYTGYEMTVANHNGYPTIPAFGGNYNMGLDKYYDKKKITVSSSGSSKFDPNANVNNPINHDAGNANPSTSSTSSSPSYTPTSPPLPFANNVNNQHINGMFDINLLLQNDGSSDSDDDSTTIGGANAAIAFANDNVDNDNTNCDLGTFRCGQDKSQFETCDHGGWVVRPCASGLVCNIGGKDPNPCKLK